MYASMLLAPQSRLTLEQIIIDIPHDFAALVVYLMMGALVAFIWLGSNPSTVARYSAKRSTEPAESQPEIASDTAGHALEPSPVVVEPEPEVLRPAGRKRAHRRRAADRIVWIG